MNTTEYRIPHSHALLTRSPAISADETKSNKNRGRTAGAADPLTGGSPPPKINRKSA
ncbi:MAG: hypothetical protein V4584_18165 [Verrucomicrobiota bacterium]